MATIDELGLTPYERIMAQMTPTMNPYTGAGVAIGGYDPALYRRMSGSGLINYGGGGGGMGGGGGGGDFNAAPSAWSSMTPAEQAAYYTENPNMASVTRGLQGLFGNTLYGQIQNYFNPGFVSEQGLIAMGVNPAAYQAAKESFRASEIADMNGGFQSIAAQQEAQQQALNQALNDLSARQETQMNAAPDTGGGGGGGEGIGGGDISGQSEGTPALAMGGPVDRVGGPNPPGPDDGTGMLQLGEYVIKKSAVKKYGQGLLDMINDGKIPAKKMKSLLG
jgi:hypothetical protein